MPIKDRDSSAINIASMPESGRNASAMIEKVALDAYSQYALSVCTSRALPDARDGLKPVQRRILFCMYKNGFDHKGRFVKSARVIGDVLGKYHPHGDASVYDAATKLVQPFGINIPPIIGQGNFGSVDGDPPAAIRYTEMKLSKMSSYLTADIPFEVVDFVPNYDSSTDEPTILPTQIPLLLTNGASGIAVGIATNIPPHNLGELIDVCIAYLDNKDISIEEIMQLMPGPDFPTGTAVIFNQGIENYYRTGRGSVIMRASIKVEKNRLIIEEIPYMMNKSRIVVKIAELARGAIDGITSIRDESDRSGIKVVIDLHKHAEPEIVINMLYKYAGLQTNFSVNMMALNRGIPSMMNVKDCIKIFIEFRQHIVTRRTRFKIKQAIRQANSTIALLIALANLDRMIEIIRNSVDLQAARELLVTTKWTTNAELDDLAKKSFCGSNIVDGGILLSQEQADVILDIRLHRIVSLEREKILSKMRELAQEIEMYHKILNNVALVNNLIKEELMMVKSEFATARKTRVILDSGDLSSEDLIQNKLVILVLSRMGYIKRSQIDSFRTQRLGGRGKLSINLKDEDELSHMIVANMRDMLLVFTDLGKVYSTSVYKLPAMESGSGKLLENVLSLRENENSAAVVAIHDKAYKEFLVFVTKNGVVKKHAFDDFARVRVNGKTAISIAEGDALVAVCNCNDTDYLFLSTSMGKCVRFMASDLRVHSSTSSYGVRGARLAKGDKVVGMTAVNSEDAGSLIMTLSSLGYVKSSDPQKYRVTKRGAGGVKDMKVGENGNVAEILTVTKDSHIVAMTQYGNVIRCSAGDVRAIGRDSKGVKLFNLNDDEKIIAAASFEPPQSE